MTFGSCGYVRTLLVWSIPCVAGLDNGLGLTPPMGWLSWERYGCSVNEDLYKRMADALVKFGYK